MAHYFPEGTRLFYSVTLGSARTITGITNANPPVVSATAHGFVDNNEVLINSGWEEINESVFKVDQLTVDTFSLLGLDATSTTLFPAGSGAGTAQLISNWVEVQQLLNVSTQGGNVTYGDIPLLGRRLPLRQAIGVEPMTFNFEVSHDPALTSQIALIGLSRVRAKVALRLLVSGVAPILGYGQIDLNPVPQMARGQVNRLQGSFSMNGVPTAYAS